MRFQALKFSIFSALLILLPFATGCNRHDNVGVACEIRQEALDQLRDDTTKLVRNAVAALDTMMCNDVDGAKEIYTHINKLLYDLHHRGHGSQAIRISRAILSVVENAEDYNPIDKRERLNLYVVLGKILSESGMPSASLDFYTKGIEVCTDSADLKYKALYLNNIGVIYADADMLDKALEYFNKALDINTHLHVHHEVYLNYANLAELYALRGDSAKAQDAAQKSLDHLNGDSNPILLANMRVQQGKGYERLEQYDVALLRYNSALRQYEEHDFNSGMVETYILLSDIYLRQQLPDSALYYASAALQKARGTNQAKLLVKALSQLSDVQNRRGDSVTAYHLLKESVSLADSLHTTEAGMRLDNWEGLDHASVDEPPASASGNVWRVLLWIAGILVVLAAIGLPMWMARRNRELRRANEDNLSDLKGELNHCNRELTTLSLEKIRISEFMEGVCDELKTVLLELNPRESAKREHIRHLLGRMEQLSSESGDEEFRQYFERVHPDFYKTLSDRYPELTQRDLRLCAFIYLGLNTKEIASMSYREVRSVESARNRLRKKLGLENSDDLQTFFQELYSGPAS